MAIQNHTFISCTDSIEISYIVSLPDGEPKAILQMAHGMAEHKERYISMMEFFAAKGYLCVMNDHRGHGESLVSKEDRGYMYKGGYQAMVEDIHQLTTIIKAQYPSKSVVLFGHSMGSMVVRSYMKRYDNEISGLIVCGSPSYNAASGIGLFIARTLRKIYGDHHRSALLQKMTFGGNNKGIEAPTSGNSWLCTDPTVVAAYDKDPECGFTFTTNGFENLLLLMKDSYDRNGWTMSNPSIPILFISGEDDPCRISDKAFFQAVNTMKKVGYTNVSYVTFSGMRHEIHNEPRKEEVFQEITSFLEESSSLHN